MKTRIARSIGIKTKTERGVEVYENVLFSHDVKAGTEVELSDKDYALVVAALKKMLKAQEILKKAWEAAGVHDVQ